MNVRYDLRDPKILRWTMDHPGRGTPYSIRELAETVGLTHHALIGHLLTGERQDCDITTAHRIAGAVGVAILVLFAPPASPEQNGSDPDRQNRSAGATPPPT
ncbi:XRE family transcriptional regulator [Streptomyces sp. NPDC002668]|uniref:XRE family transcriptional regulator n=1 Tax=Streptomyces sp. NPDC002668 TaxID=3154422 RepID=UPI0033259EEC